MGNNKINRLLKEEQKWTDKTAPRHKHEFTVHCLMQLRNMDNAIEYYDVMKCRHCNSFHSVPHIGAINGFLNKENLESLRRELDGVPILKLYRSHKWSIGFNDMTVDTEYDKIVYKERLFAEMRRQGATDDDLFLVDDDVIKVAMKNNKKPEDLAWALLQ